jgi:hypothetical protein
MTTALTLPTGSWVADDKRASGRRLVNCFSEIAPQTGAQDTKSTLPPAYLRRMFGISPYADIGSFQGSSPLVNIDEFTPMNINGPVNGVTFTASGGVLTVAEPYGSNSGYAGLVSTLSGLQTDNCFTAVRMTSVGDGYNGYAYMFAGFGDGTNFIGWAPIIYGSGNIQPAIRYCHSSSAGDLAYFTGSATFSMAGTPPISIACAVSGTIITPYASYDGVTWEQLGTLSFDASTVGFTAASLQQCSAAVGGYANFIRSYASSTSSSVTWGPISALTGGSAPTAGAAAVGQVRGMRTMGGITYAVIGETLYKLVNNGTMTNPSTSATLTQVATGITGNGFVRLCDNTQCLFILLPGTNIGYTYTVNNGLQEMLDETFLFYGAKDVWFIDSYMVFLALNGQEFYNDDGQTASGTGPITFTTGGVFPREFGTDQFIGMCVDHRTVHMFGELTSEGYVDAGNATESPFAAAPDAFMQIGCNPHCGYTVALQDQSVFWVANDLTVRRLNGQTPVRVSNSGVEALLENNKFNLYGAYALTPTIGGHPLWVLTLPLAKKTIVYDCLTTEWFDLESLYNDIGYWRPLCWYNAQGLQLVGDSQFAQIGFLDENTFTEWGLPQRAKIYTQSVYDNHNRISHHRVEAVVTAGQGTSATSAPTITLFKSDDGGYTWVAREGKQLGVMGYGSPPARAVWWRLGQARDRSYEFQISDPTIFFMVAIVTEVSGGKW